MRTCLKGSLSCVFILLCQLCINGISIVPLKLKHFFEFALPFFHDDAFILMYILECKDVRQDNRTYSATYDFTLLRDWWVVNVMKLCSSINASAMVSVASNAQYFQCIFIATHVFNRSVWFLYDIQKNLKLVFSWEECAWESILQRKYEFKKHGVFIGKDDVYFIYTNEKDWLINESIFWQGAR